MADFYFRTEGLSVGYRGIPLLHDIKIGLKRGDILSLIGPNGAGKTTVLKHILRQMAPLSGVIYLDGRDLTGYSGSELAKKQSVVLTQRVSPELMTCEDVVAMGRYPYTGKFGVLTPADWDVVHQSMDLLAISDLAKRNFSQTSDGQKQRVMLSRALCQQPEILILDEPTAYLDIRYKIELLDILRKMARTEHITVIMTLHEIDLAMKASDLILCVQTDGTTRFGTPDEISRLCPVETLYGLEKGSYNSLLGSVELTKPQGRPEVFVVAGGGWGTPCYRELQKLQIPFATGILFENDVDFQAARVLSAQTISAPAFTPMTQAQFDAAASCMLQCRTVLDAGTPAGPLNERNRQLLCLAREHGIPIETRQGGAQP